MPEAPPVTLSDKYARCLEDLLADWKESVEGHLRGAWQTDLENYFRAAQRLQNAGCNLRHQLVSWQEFLARDPRFAKQSKQVRLILEGTH